MKRNIIHIDEVTCNGCGLCIPNCHEGALQIIDGKARLISDLFCDGLGACIGHCPQEAITIEEREAEPYNERLVMERIAAQGRNTILAHLAHLKEHNEQVYLKEAVDYILENNIDMSEPIRNIRMEEPSHDHTPACGCSGSAMQDFLNTETLQGETKASDVVTETPSELTHWPIQLHLLNPAAGYLRESDLLLASDCSSFTMGNFHQRFIRGKTLAIACPKLDQGKDIYIDKLASMIRDSKVKSITVVMMEVPCCGGLSTLVQQAMQKAGRTIPVKDVIMSIRGDILKEMIRN
ncbi:MAG: 4Fe-4S ferredoxin [Bacteroidetes bacterium]|nr:4Fe-4S ferredoxin [Bacteroidota bacterium]